MKIKKEGRADTGAAVSAEELAQINVFTKREFAADEVFSFSLILCDNDVDRDFERFSERTLAELAELFVGKTGISDHEWKSGNQIARIYRTELIHDPVRKTATGEPYVGLKAWAYMLRTEDNAALIADIEGGIKKEISVGCAVGESRCSICGEISGSCAHVKGETYGGVLCCSVLEGAVDAYEWSFVAVPAQRNAGVTKRFDVSKGLKGFVETADGRDFAAELELLQKQAALGRQYLQNLRQEVLRLCLLCDRQLHKSMQNTVEHMEEAALLDLKAAMEQRAAERLPIRTQLPGLDDITRFDGGEYLI